MRSQRTVNRAGIFSEDYIPIKEASENIPGNPSRSVINRWIRQGLLESAVIGRKRFISHQAIARMLKRMNENELEEIQPMGAAVREPIDWFLKDGM